MNLLAFILDGGRRFHPPLPVHLAAYLMPLIAVACCCMIARNPRLLSYAAAVAGVAAGVLLVPLYRIAVNVYDDAYDSAELSLFWFHILLPFVSIAAARRAIRKTPNQSPEPTR